MSMRIGFGPVFASECLTTSRRWQFYAGRVLLLASLLIGLALVSGSWRNSFYDELPTYQQLAIVGQRFVFTILSVELVLTLVVVPAAAAGVICHDKMSGALTLMMTTDLSDAEIVLGKFASRLLVVLGVIACGFPVLAITMSIGGVDPVATFGGTLVIIGVAFLAVSVTFTFSVWATKPHEALMATYAAWAIWLLSALVVTEVFRGLPGRDFLNATNPFWLIFVNPFRGANLMNAQVTFFGGALLVSSLLAAVSTWRLRPVTLRQSSQGARSKRARRPLFSNIRKLENMLDRAPILWRERVRRQSSGWGRIIWYLYAFFSTIFAVVAIFQQNITAGTLGFMLSIGLLLVSVSAATALAEERAHGSLDLLMSTPLSTREIVLGKWRGAFRIVPRLAILPSIVGFAICAPREGLGSAFLFAALIVNLILAYGAAITSIGIALASWQKRLSRAVALSVSIYLSITVIYPTIMLNLSHSGPNDLFRLWPSPFFGMLLPMGWNTFSWRRGGDFGYSLVAIAVWATLTYTFAAALLWLTIWRFDRLLGRIPDRSARLGSNPTPSRSSRKQPQSVE